MSHFADDRSLDIPSGKSPRGTRYVGKEQFRMGLRGRFEMSPKVTANTTPHRDARDPSAVGIVASISVLALVFLIVPWFLRNAAS
jgi:hypothetical protein